MTNYVLIGSGTTDENGVAKLDHDANGNPIDHSYIGVGAGEIDVLASLDNPVVEGSIVSETFNVCDAWMKDGGVTGDANNDDWLVQTGGSRTVGSDGTVFSGDTGTLFAWINKHGTTHSGLTDIAEYSGDYGIELTVVEVNGSARCSIYEAYPSPKRVDIPLSVGKWLIKRINNVITAFKDGVAYPITSLSLNAPQRIGIIASQGDSVKLRDIAVYGLGGTELGLTANKQIIESGETTTLSAYLSEGSGNTVQLYNADTDTLIDTMTDVGNGQYTYTVTGTGSGQKRYYVKYGSIVSQPYEVIDALWFDDTSSSSSTLRYYVEGDNSLAYSNGEITYTVGSSAKYIKVNGSSGMTSDIANYVGKTVRFEVDVDPSYQVRIIVYQKINNQNVYSPSSSSEGYVSTAQTLQKDITIDANATQLQFRIDCSNNNANETVKFKNCKVYVISNS